MERDSSPLSPQPPEDARHLSWLELFFDLIFVLAVTQVAGTHEHDLSLAGFLHFVLVFLPLWWGWVGFSFYVNRFPREDNIVRLAVAFFRSP